MRWFFSFFKNNKIFSKILLTYKKRCAIIRQPQKRKYKQADDGKGEKMKNKPNCNYIEVFLYDKEIKLIDHIKCRRFTKWIDRYEFDLFDAETGKWDTIIYSSKDVYTMNVDVEYDAIFEELVKS